MKHHYAGDYSSAVKYRRGDVVRLPNGKYHVFSSRGFVDVAAPPDPSCQGRDGIDGRDGRDGVDGRDGERGDDGKDGERGKRGPRGKEGASYHTSSTIVRHTANLTRIEIGFSESVALGDVVRIAGDNIAAKAIGHGTDAEALAIGLVSAANEVQTSGPLVNEAWSLTPGTVYYLSPDVPGAITATFPNTIGDRVIIIGTAITPVKLNIDIHWALIIGS